MPLERRMSRGQVLGRAIEARQGINSRAISIAVENRLESRLGVTGEQQVEIYEVTNVAREFLEAVARTKVYSSMRLAAVRAGLVERLS
ncbi:hypothetical protein [Paraburkholderia pallida]|uniref:Uncharacterized protein n=1 Tax=Paraburkholderia pallida TaxID=2547399 RepID=A0A4P7D9V6_9BURK|nr:hypothetical protein [Paraburkholderia pallida]QBR04217.1 hypothetical protein E1956_44630 [Paraburkholderia pallida]